MMIVAAIAPPVVWAAPHAFRHEHISRDGAVVTIRPDLRRILVAVPQMTSPGRWQAPASVSTSSSYAEQATELAVVTEPPRASVSLPPQIAPADQVPFILTEIKRMTGWSWERIAAALNRTRQAVHAWTLGKEISQPSLERLARLYTTLSYIDRGSAEQNRALLNTAAGDGGLVADLLDAGHFDQARAQLGQGDGGQKLAARLRLANGAQEEQGRKHWFDRLAETSGEEQPLETIPSGERKRLVLRRRG